MNLPNKLTLLRVFMVPVFLVFALIDTIPYNEFIAVGIFAIASITDALDGYIARKNNLVTNFGKFLDPLADTAVIVQKLNQIGYRVSKRSVERTITEFGLQKKRMF